MMTSTIHELDTPLDSQAAAYAGGSAGKAPPAARSRANWIPIRSLTARHRPRILNHLLALTPGDRYLRFGHVAADAQIGRYVDLLDFDRDEVFGIFNRRLELVAMAHLASLGPKDEKPRSAEFGVSVAAGSRGRGFGARLFDRAALHARNRGIDCLLIHALSENTAMLRIARNAGAVIELDGPESQAWLKLPPDDLVSHVEAIVEDRAAELDFGLKVHVRQMDSLLQAFSGRPAASDRNGGD
jgi:RimJ/RimL family protein N-acetyltransferase